MTPTEGMKMEWISVENRLPKEGDTVLCYNSMICTGFYQNEYCPFEESKKGWNLDLSEDELDICEDYEVTHWMPLPNPPES